MKKSTKIIIGAFLLIIGSFLFMVPIIQLTQFGIETFDISLGLLLPIGLLLIMIGLAIVLTVIIPEKYRQNTGRDGWDRMRWPRHR